MTVIAETDCRKTLFAHAIYSQQVEHTAIILKLILQEKLQPC